MLRCFPLLLLLALVFACSHTSIPIAKDLSGQWILESYDADKGYTFRKDGVTYVAHCNGFMSAEEIQTMPHGAIPMSNPNSSYDEGLCSAVLDYLHKPVPVKYGEPYARNVLYYPKATDGSLKNGVLEFLITEAK